jgi:hypothetical protein
VAIVNFSRVTVMDRDSLSLSLSQFNFNFSFVIIGLIDIEVYSSCYFFGFEILKKTVRKYFI